MFGSPCSCLGYCVCCFCCYAYQCDTLNKDARRGIAAIINVKQVRAIRAVVSPYSSTVEIELP